MKNLFLLIFTLLFSQTLFAQTWQSLYQKADSLMQKRLFKEAITFYEQALTIAEKEVGTQNENYLAVRNGLGRSMSYVYEKEKTASFLAENLELSKKNGEKTVFYATALFNAGTFYLPISKGNDPLKSEIYLKQAYELRKELLGTKHKDYLSSLNNLAVLYRNIGNYSSAESLYKEVLQIRKETLSKQHPDYLTSLNNLANLYYSTNRYLLAEPLYQEALRTRKEVLGEKHPDYAQSLNNLAVLYMDLDNYAKAEPYYHEVLRLRKEVLGTKHTDYTNALNNLGLLYGYMGRYDQAERLYQECLQIRKETLGTKHALYASTLLNLAILYQNTANFAQAEKLYREVLNTQKEVLGEKHVDYALTLNNLGVLYKEMGRTEEASALFWQALRIYEASVGTANEQYVRVLTNLTELYRDKNAYAFADSLGKEKLQINQKSGGMGLFWAYNILGTVYTRQARPAEAESNLLKADSMLQKMQIAKTTLNGLYNQYYLGLHYWQNRQTEKAKPVFWDIKAQMTYQILENFPSMSDLERENFYEGVFKKYSRHFQSFALEEKHYAYLYDWQLFAKGILLNSVQKMKSRIRNSQDSVLIGDYEKWNSLKLSLAQYAQMSQEELAQKNIKIDSLERIANDMEKALSLRSESFAKLSDKKQITWKDIQKKLRKGEAAVEMIRVNKFGVQKIVTDSTDYAYYRNTISLRNGISKGEFPQYPLYGLTDTVYYAALIVRHNSKEPELVILKNGNELENKHFKMYRNSARYQIQDKNSYQQYWQAIREKLGKVKKVYFSPDGIYNQINLNILQNPENQQFIIDEMEIQQVTNTKEILAFNPTQTLPTGEGLKKTQGFKAVLFGRPAYDMDSLAFLANIELAKASNQNYALRDMRDLRSGKFSDLLGTEREVNLIDSMLRSKGLTTEKYTLGQATEAKIKSMKSPNILHIATHGFFISDSTTKNPMLNSGVLLAGVSNYYRSEEKPDTDDGVLTSQEAQNLNLDKTDLVVLSACETGLGEVRNGEGVYGLQRAFKAAGAKSLLMSHWKVDDRVTQELMSKFYEYWLRLEDRRKAFAQAQAQIRKRYPSPYYWGAFVLVGQ